MSCKGWTESNSGHSVIDTCFVYTILGMKGPKQCMKLQSDIGHFPKIFGACPNKKIIVLLLTVKQRIRARSRDFVRARVRERAHAHVLLHSRPRVCASNTVSNQRRRPGLRGRYVFARWSAIWGRSYLRQHACSTAAIQAMKRDASPVSQQSVGR